MTQSFKVVENQTERKGAYVAVKETVSDVRAILDGKYDNYVPEDFLFIGGLKELAAKHPAGQTNKPAQPLNGTQSQPNGQPQAQAGSAQATQTPVTAPPPQPTTNPPANPTPASAAPA